MMSKNVEIVQSYFNAVAAADYDTVNRSFADHVIWHQPGKGIQSGTFNGKADVFGHLGDFAKWSDGTFAIDEIEYLSDNGNLVTAAIHFKAEKADQKLSMRGIDLLRVEDGLIQEVWLFSEKIDEEDAFWNSIASV